MANPGPSVTSGTPTQNLATTQALRLLAVYKGVDLNKAGDTVLPVIATGNFSVFQVVLTNASISLTTAAAGLFTSPSAGGTAIVANAALSAATGPTVVSQRTVASTAVVSGTSKLYWNVGTPQGAAATGDVYVYGYDFS